MEKCPFCAEQIQSGAIFCHHCKSDLKKPEEGKVYQNTQQNNSNNSCLLIGGGCCCLVVLVFSVFVFVFFLNGILFMGNAAVKNSNQTSTTTIAPNP